MRRTIAGTTSVSAAVVLLLVVNVSHGDVLSPPPKDCPAGTQASSCHGPGLCFPLKCQTDADCGPNMRCLGQQLCLEKINCGGGYSPKYVDSARTACPGGASCMAGSCTMVRVCLPKPPMPDAQPPVPDVSKPVADTSRPAPDSARPGADRAITGGDPSTPRRGCSCASGSGGGGTPWCVLVLAWLFAARRRKPRR